MSAGVPDARAQRAAYAVLGVLLAGSAVLLYVVGRGDSFFYDEWNFILDSRANTAAAFLTPHNGHFSLVPIAIYRLLFALVGLRHYGPYRLVLIALHLTVGVLVFVLLRRRAGPWIALIGAGLVLFLGRGWENLIWPFQIGSVGSIAAGLGALVCLDRRTRAGDLAGAVLLTIGIASTGFGIPFVVGAAVALLVSRTFLRRCWVVVVPLVVYGAWYLHYGQSEASLSNLTAVPGYIFDAFGGAVGGLTGLGPIMHRPETAVAVAVLALACWYLRPDRYVLVPISIALALWTLTALSRAELREPTASRYVYPGTILLVLVVGELLRRVRLPVAALVVLAGLTAVAIGLNLVTLRDAERGQRLTDQTVDAELQALQLARATAPASLQPDPVRAPQITAGRYFRAIDALGSPALPLAVLPQLAPALRSSVDTVLLAAEPPRIRPDVASVRDCRRASAEVIVPRAGLVVRSSRPIHVAFVRYGDPSPGLPQRTLTGERRISFPRDASPLPWRALIAPSGAVTVCIPP